MIRKPLSLICPLIRPLTFFGAYGLLVVVWVAMVAAGAQAEPSVNPISHTTQNPVVATESGKLLDLVEELTSREYSLHEEAVDPRPYVEPSFELPTLYRASRHLMKGYVDEAARLAAKVDYEIVRFNDTETDHHYLVLRENVSRLSQPRGWGSYLLNPHSSLPALIEAPHPQDDWHSAKVAARVFSHGARGLMIAGSHRGKADVPDLVDSVFHQVHVAWSSSLERMTVWQIHGFAGRKHVFPRNAKAILSTGGGQLINEMLVLDERFNERGIETYAYNRLAPNSPLNKWINGGTPGLRFSSLSATQNEQGRHLRSLGGTFVHVELEWSLRSEEEKRRIAAEAIAESVAATAGR